VILPDLNAGCSMADMADIGQVEVCWEELSSIDDLKLVPIAYMNSTAAIKSFTGEHGGSVCTSSNAAAVMRWAFDRGERVLFLPDEHLGRNTAFRMGIPLDQMIVWDPFQDFGGNSLEAIRNARVILWKGYCSVHQRLQPHHIERVRRMHPGIQVIVHPECRYEVARAADRLDRADHQSCLRIPGRLEMGDRDGDSPGQPAQQGNAGAYDYVAGSQRLRVHHYVSHHAAAPALGARQPGGG
jgi:quinolinate synthase